MRNAIACSAVLWAACAMLHTAARGEDQAVAAVVPGFDRFAVGDGAVLAPAEAGRLLLNELQCTACHQASGEVLAGVAPRQAPLLDGVGNRVKPEWLRAFLSDPQQVKPGTTMPHLGAALPEAQRAAAIEALVHFLASQGSAPPRDVMPQAQAVARGQRLYHTVGCVACHDPQGDMAAAWPHSVPLGALERKYSHATLAAFLANPLAVRPSGRMPHLNLNNNEASDVAHFLLRGVRIAPNVAYRYYEGSWSNLPDFDKLEPAASGETAGLGLGIARRNDHFGIRFEGWLHVARRGSYTFHLGSDDGGRLYLGDTLVVDNDGTHPHQVRSARVELEPGAQRVRIDYFEAGGDASLQVEWEGPGVPRQPLDSSLTLSSEHRHPPGEPPFEVQPELVQRGRQLFASLGCASCHSLSEGGQRIASSLEAPPLGSLQGGEGCLAPQPPPRAPQYALRAAQRDALSAALRSLGDGAPAAEDPRRVIHHSMLAFNCYACHAREGRGGVEPQRDAFFLTSQPEMGDEGRLPPPLDGAGDKLRLDWLKTLLTNGGSDRPYMSARMPRFPPSALDAFIAALAAADAQSPRTLAELDEPPHRVRSHGRFLVGDKALSCIKCHTFNNVKATGIQAIDLLAMPRKLRQDWFVRYMLNPAQFRPGTRMPQAWPRGQSLVADVLGGNAEAQILAIWTYLSDGTKARIPDGLAREPMELRADSEAIIYRNFIEGAGPRAIGVGYPEKLNLAFDAENLRIALLWHGRFMDASRHWTGRGQGFEPPLGDHVLALPVATPLFVSGQPPLSAASARQQGYAFGGYRLGAQRRPTFMYRFGQIDVEDTPVPIVEGELVGFRRTLVLRAEGGFADLMYRAAVGSKIEPQEDGWFLVDGALRVRVAAPGGAAPQVLNHEGRAVLVVPVACQDGGATIVQEYVW
jgi:mono/diheme cytochrome c family protein